MSAFSDVWISNDAGVLPVVRTDNQPWEYHGDKLWLSLPSTGLSFLTHAVLGHYSLVLVGQLYECISGEEILKRCIKYITHPGNGFADPAGHYIMFVQDNENKHTHVFTNRLGSYHAYWSGDRIISTRYLALARAKVNKQLNWQGLSGFMAMGYFPADSTYLEGVSIFEPASHYHFNDELQFVNKQRYWQWTYNPTIKPVEFYTEQLHAILQDSLSVSTKDKRTCIPISGGLDSRMLAGELVSDNMSHTELKALSYGYFEGSKEIKIGKQVADKLGIPAYTYVMPDYLFRQLDEIVDAVELFQYVDGTRQASAINWLKGNADVVVGGHWGDVWMDTPNISSVDGLQNAFQKKIVKKGAEWLLKNICQPNFKNAGDIPIAYFDNFMSGYDDIQDADFKMKIYKTDQWSFRWTTASVRMYQAARMPVLPFYDNRIVDLFTTMPQDMVNNRELQVAYIKQYHQALAGITWQEYDADLYNYKQFSNRNISYRVVDKIKRIISNEPAIQRNWEVFYMHPEGRKALESKLLNNKLLQDVVPEAVVRELINDIYKSPTAANGYTVSMLLTFSLFLNRVFA